MRTFLLIQTAGRGPDTAKDMQCSRPRKRLRRVADHHDSDEDAAEGDRHCPGPDVKNSHGPAKVCAFILGEAGEEAGPDGSDEDEEDMVDDGIGDFIVEGGSGGSVVVHEAGSHRQLDREVAEVESLADHREALRIAEDLRSRSKHIPRGGSTDAADSQRPGISEWWSKHAAHTTTPSRKRARETPREDTPRGATPAPAKSMRQPTMRESTMRESKGGQPPNQVPSTKPPVRPFQSKETQLARFQIASTQELASAIKTMSSCLKDDCCVLYCLDEERWEIIGIGSSKVIYTRTQLPVHSVVLPVHRTERAVYGAISLSGLRGLGTKASSAQSVICGIFESEVEAICSHSGSGSSFTTLLLAHLEEDAREPIPKQLQIYFEVFDRQHRHNYTLGKDDILDPKVTREDEKYVELNFGETSLTIRCGTTATTSTHPPNPSQRAPVQGSHRLVTLKEYYSKVVTCILQSDGSPRLRVCLTPDAAILVSRVARNESRFRFDALLAHSSEEGG